MPVALIGPDLVRRLPRRNTDIRDTKLTGFGVRCRASGAHSYVVFLGRGHVRTIGRVGDLHPEAARTAAQALLGGLNKKVLALVADDPSMSRREAREQATREIRQHASRRLTWRQYLEQHYGPWVVEQRKTGAETLARLRALFATFDDVPLSQITPYLIERWRTQRLKAGRSAATVNRDLAALRGALTQALRWRLGGLRTHPMAEVRAAKVDPLERKRYLTPDEEARLLAALDARDDRRRRERASANEWRQARGYPLLPAYGRYTDHLAPLVRLALHTGCRRGELLSLRWADVDLANRTLAVRAAYAKSQVARTIPLNDIAVDVLRAWRPADARDDAYVFPGSDGGPLDDVKTAFRALLRSAKIRGFRFHDLRHTFASRLVQAGVDLNAVRELLGHADLKMTLRYSHLAPGHTAAAVAKLAEQR